MLNNELKMMTIIFLLLSLTIELNALRKVENEGDILFFFSEMNCTGTILDEVTINDCRNCILPICKKQCAEDNKCVGFAKKSWAYSEDTKTESCRFYSNVTCIKGPGGPDSLRWWYYRKRSECANNRCKNGGVCQVDYSKSSGWFCKCQHHWIGQLCEDKPPTVWQEMWWLWLLVIALMFFGFLAIFLYIKSRVPVERAQRQQQHQMDTGHINKRTSLDA